MARILGEPDTTNTMIAISTDLVRAAIAGAHGDRATETAALGQHADIPVAQVLY